MARAGSGAELLLELELLEPELELPKPELELPELLGCTGHIRVRRCRVARGSESSVSDASSFSDVRMLDRRLVVRSLQAGRLAVGASGRWARRPRRRSAWLAAV